MRCWDGSADGYRVAAHRGAPARVAASPEGGAAVSRDDLSALALLAAAAALVHAAGQVQGRALAAALVGSAVFVVSLATVLWGRGDDM